MDRQQVMRATAGDKLIFLPQGVTELHKAQTVWLSSVLTNLTPTLAKGETEYQIFVRVVDHPAKIDDFKRGVTVDAKTLMVFNQSLWRRITKMVNDQSLLQAALRDVLAGRELAENSRGNVGKRSFDLPKQEQHSDMLVFIETTRRLDLVEKEEQI